LKGSPGSSLCWTPVVVLVSWYGELGVSLALGGSVGGVRLLGLYLPQEG
jgi:hypothetical protein